MTAAASRRSAALLGCVAAPAGAATALRAPQPQGAGGPAQAGTGAVIAAVGAESEALDRAVVRGVSTEQL